MQMKDISKYADESNTFKKILHHLNIIALDSDALFQSTYIGKVRR